jgi:hypothetical protein
MPTADDAPTGPGRALPALPILLAAAMIAPVEQAGA